MGAISQGRLATDFPLIFPAWAWKTICWIGVLHWGFCMAQGSSPLTRGKRDVRPRKMPAVRPISAHAGKTHNATRVAHLPGDHSQVGWLPPSCVPCHYSEKDSSLLTRGTPGPWEEQSQRERIIPAYAGNTPSDLCKHHTAQADYGSAVERLPLSYSFYRTPTTKEAQLESLVRHRYERPQAHQTFNQ